MLRNLINVTRFKSNIPQHGLHTSLVTALCNFFKFKCIEIWRCTIKNQSVCLTHVYFLTNQPTILYLHMLVSLSCYVASHGSVAEQEEDRIVFSLFPLNLQTKDLIHTITITLLMTAGETYSDISTMDTMTP